MDILFVHQNFPGQFRHLATALAADRGNRVAALCINAPAAATPGVMVGRYRPTRGSSPSIHPLATDFETKVIRGEACAAAALELKKKGFTPDLIVVHPGWGEHLFLRDIWPDARIVAFLEFFYGARGQDTGFDPEFAEGDLLSAMRTRAKNANALTALDTMDWGLSPTRWQRSTFPALHRPRISTIFDGTDTAFMAPDPAALLTLPDGRTVKAGDEVLTFVNRNLEPYRGFHVFMRALPAIQRARPDAITLIVGGDDVSYGRKPADGRSWRAVMMAEVGDRLDLSRIAFLGRIPYDRFRLLLQVSRVHAYLTYPFVLSWSMLEAMACEALVIGSDVPPVAEVIADGRNGLLVPFLDIDRWIETITDALARPEPYRDLRRAARADVVARYDLASVCLPAQLRLVADVAVGRVPQDGLTE
jgi:glycosyltransferase involved in cell wall biosynthesis